MKTEEIKITSLDEAKKVIKEMTKRWSSCDSMSMTCGGVWAPNGEIISLNESGACHAWLNVAYAARVPGRVQASPRPLNPLKYVLSCYAGPVFTEKTLYGSWCPEEEQRQFIKWWVSKDNPLSKFILVPDEDFVYNYGLIIDGEKASWAEALLLCKVLRQAHENPSSRHLWCLLTSRGLDPMIALLASERFHNGESCFKDTYQLKQFSSHCTSFDPCYNRGLENLITRTVITPKNDTGKGASVFLTSGGVDPFKVKSTTFKVSNGWGSYVKTTGVTVDTVFKVAKELEISLKEKTRRVTVAEPKIVKVTAAAPLKTKKRKAI